MCDLLNFQILDKHQDLQFEHMLNNVHYLLTQQLGQTLHILNHLEDHLDSNRILQQLDLRL